MQNKAIETASSNNNKEEELYDIHKELCEALNMDEATKEKSWQSYRSISYNYTLNGNQNHWLCCSIFVACRQSLIKTVGDQSSLLEGNCVSLTRLLRICNISIYEFFQKIRQWMEMASTPKSFRNKVEKLERGFAVSVLLYRKFSPIFEDLFKCSKGDEKGKSNKKSKPLPCSPTKLYEFAWCLFVSAKGEYPDHSVDLVTSFHMLLCCCDLIYANVINEKRTDLINPKFKGVPAEWGNDDFDPEMLDRPMCIIEDLCQLYEGTALDALHTKMYIWKPVIEKMFSNNILKGNSKTFLDLITPGNFEANLKSLNNVYETFVLSCGEVDERIFLRHFQFGSRNFGANGAAATVEEETIQSLVPQTPLTGRNYLRGRDPVAPLAIAHDNVSKLRAVFGNCHNELPPGLKELLRKTDFESALTQQLKDRLTEMSTIFNENVQSIDRWSLVEALYFHLLLNIMEGEIKLRPGLDVKVLIKEDQLHRTLIVCCVEIIVYSYNPQRRFPEVLQWYNMHPFNFYRIIEMVVLNHADGLTRDIIKHLNVVEEQTLESFAWEANSPLWDRIRGLGLPLPLCQDVDKPKILNSSELAGITPLHAFQRNDVNKKTDLGFLASPSGVKKQLFQEDKGTEGPKAPIGEINMRSVITCSQESTGNGSDGASTSSQDEARDQNYQLLASTRKANRGGSLALFFRKFYKLASVRMLALCKGLELNDPDLLKKIWTVFEHSIVEQTDLMKDRHLDQMIMCAIYVIFRVTKQKKNFKDIMSNYRSQPQWASHIYRSVLIGYGDNGDTKESPEKQPNRYEPGDLAGTAQNYGNERRGDIIKFYNTVYVKKMQEFAMKFADTASKESLLLSPLPHNPNQIMSPKKVSEHHSIYIQPLGKNLLKSPGRNNCITYEFPRSPIKDSPSKGLMEINRIVNQNRSVKRPILATEESSADDHVIGKRPKIPRKLESLISDRQGRKD